MNAPLSATIDFDIMALQNSNDEQPLNLAITRYDEFLLHDVPRLVRQQIDAQVSFAVGLQQ